MLKRLYSLALHPSAAKRLGAALAFNNIYMIFRQVYLLMRKMYICALWRCKTYIILMLLISWHQKGIYSTCFILMLLISWHQKGIYSTCFLKPHGLLVEHVLRTKKIILHYSVDYILVVTCMHVLYFTHCIIHGGGMYSGIMSPGILCPYEPHADFVY